MGWELPPASIGLYTWEPRLQLTIRCSVSYGTSVPSGWVRQLDPARTLACSTRRRVPLETSEKRVANLRFHGLLRMLPCVTSRNSVLPTRQRWFLRVFPTTKFMRESSMVLKALFSKLRESRGLLPLTSLICFMVAYRKCNDYSHVVRGLPPCQITQPVVTLENRRISGLTSPPKRQAGTRVLTIPPTSRRSFAGTRRKLLCANVRSGLRRSMQNPGSKHV